jgi:hypothetical protein
MVRKFVLTIPVLLAVTGTVPAQMPSQPPPVAHPQILGQGSEQERAACHPDVMRFCREMVKDGDDSDVFAILGCLQTNRRKISRACGEVLASHGQ